MEEFKLDPLTKFKRCPQCDYDLQGTPDRCPECGWHATPKPHIDIESWECLTCGESVDEGFTNCWKCGSDINGESELGFDSESNPSVEEKICLSCGRRGLYASDDMCRKCEGKLVTIDQTPEYIIEARKRAKRLIKPCFIMTLVAWTITTCMVIIQLVQVDRERDIPSAFEIVNFACGVIAVFGTIGCFSLLSKSS